MNDDKDGGDYIHKNSVIIFIIFYLSVIGLSAIISPILFSTTRYLAETYSVSLLQHYVDKGFGKFFLMLLLFCKSNFGWEGFFERKTAKRHRWSGGFLLSKAGKYFSGGLFWKNIWAGKVCEYRRRRDK